MMTKSVYNGKPFYFYETIESTNEQCKVLLRQNAPHGTLVAANMQTAGKGRRGRSWESPPGTNLYFSLLLRPEFPIGKASMLTLVMAYSVCRSLRKQTGLNLGIKWPNDIVAGDKKVCGILTELELQQSNYAVIVGVGINVNRYVFGPDMMHKAISLEEASGIRFSRSLLLSEIIRCFEEDYDAFAVGLNMQGFMHAYNLMLVNLDRQVKVLDPKGEYTGIARGINESGELLVETDTAKVVPVYAGEVSVRGIYGYI